MKFQSSLMSHFALMFQYQVAYGSPFSTVCTDSRKYVWCILRIVQKSHQNLVLFWILLLGPFDKSQLRSLKSNVTHIQCDIHRSLCYKSLKTNKRCHISKTDIEQNHTTNIQNDNKPVVFLVSTVINTVCFYVRLHVLTYLRLQNVPCVWNLLTETCTSPVTEQLLVTFKILHIKTIFISVFKVLKLINYSSILLKKDFYRTSSEGLNWKNDLFFTRTVKLHQAFYGLFKGCDPSEIWTIEHLRAKTVHKEN